MSRPNWQQSTPAQKTALQEIAHTVSGWSAGDIHAPQLALLATLERARVVGVLDAYQAQLPYSHEWRMVQHEDGVTFGCHIGHGPIDWSDDLQHTFTGPTPDAARAAAAKAIEWSRR